MARARTYRNVRISRNVAAGVKKRRKEEGRPNGTVKRFQFEETRLGFMIRQEAPVVFKIIMNLTPKIAFPEPSCELISIVCRASRDPSFKKAKFRRYLAEYRTTGLYCKRGKKLTPKRKVYYEAIRKKKMESFIRKNRKKLVEAKKVLSKCNRRSMNAYFRYS